MKLKFNSDGKFKILLFGDIHEHTDYKTNPRCKDMSKNSSLIYAFFSVITATPISIKKALKNSRKCFAQ